MIRALLGCVSLSTEPCWRRASHFTRRSDAGIVALPTAIGKTLVMQLLPFMLASHRVLVIVPGKLLREHVADQLGDLSLLASRGVLDPGELKPKVHLIEHEMHSDEDWTNCRRTIL